MSAREKPSQPGRRDELTPYPAEKARGGRIILRTQAQRMIFVAGLAAAAVLALVLSLLA